MDALGIGIAGVSGMMSGTDVAQKISDNILAGRIATASHTGDNRGNSLTYAGYTIFYLILQNDSGGMISTFAKYDNRVNIPGGGYWYQGKLYGYRVDTSSSSYTNYTSYGILIPVA